MDLEQRRRVRQQQPDLAQVALVQPRPRRTGVRAVQQAAAAAQHVGGGTANLVIRNTCTTNGVANFNIVAGNTKGTIFSVAGADITTSNPYANFEY